MLPPLGFDWREDPELKARIALYDRILVGLAVGGVVATIAFAVFVFAF